MLTFLEIQRKVDQICEKIGLEKKRVWPAVQNDGAPYVLIHENKYWYISEERGEVFFEKTTKEANSNMRCDSFKSHMIINKLSKFL
jgi:hypothetical protein